MIDHGRSLLVKEPRLGAFRWQKFQEQFTTNGESVWSEVESLIEPIHRFKGQSALGVVLAEVDFALFDEEARRSLFVGMTWVQLVLEIVVSRGAEAARGEALVRACARARLVSLRDRRSMHACAKRTAPSANFQPSGLCSRLARRGWSVMPFRFRPATHW